MAIKTTFRFLLALLLFSNRLSATQPFLSESFSEGIPADWTTGDLGNNVLWQHCAGFSNCLPANFLNLFFKDERFESMSVENGYALIKPHDIGSSIQAHGSFFRTKPLNCEGYDQVFLKFTTYIAAQFSDPETDAILQVRNGDSGAWTTFTIFRNLNHTDLQPVGLGDNQFLQASYHPQVVWLDISSVAANQANQDSIQIQWLWNWTGKKEYCWLLDDIALFDQDPLLEKAVWGTQPGQGDFQGGLNGWTTAFSGDTCRWDWSADGLAAYPTAGEPYNYGTGCSPSLLNGVAMMNALYCRRYGTPSEFSFSELTSPALDLSAVPPGTRLALRFHQSVKIGDAEFPNLPITSVAVSADGGASWLDTINANPLLPYDKGFCEMTSLSLPTEVAGASQVKIRFIFSGDSFFWILDDVKIVERCDNDLRVNRYFASVAPNFLTPQLQVTPISFVAEVENLGKLPQDFSTLFLHIYHEPEHLLVHEDEIFLGTLQPGEVVTDAIFSKTFKPDSLGAYSCYYRIRADLPDEDTLNNVLRWRFEVTDTVFGKARGKNAINGYFEPVGSLTYEVGNCYFIPPNPGRQFASSVSFAFNCKVNPIISLNAEFQIALYKWKTADSYGDKNVDTLANMWEFEQVAATNYKVNLSDKGKIVTWSLDPVDGQIFELEDSTYYFATVGYLTPVELDGNDIHFFMAGSEEIDYTAMFWLSYQTQQPQYVSMLRSGGSEHFRANAWALRRIPFVHLNLVSLTPAQEQKPEAHSWEIQPNPAGDFAFLSASFQEIQKNVRVEIVDAGGKMVGMETFRNVSVSQLPIDTSSLSNGAYFVRVTTDGGFAVQKLAVLRK